MKNGFTLIELLAVIVILSIIATITLFSTGEIINDAKDNLSSAQKTKLIEVAKMYYLEHSNINYVCVKNLIESGYIDTDEVLDPKTKKAITGYVDITTSGNKTTYKYKEDNVSPKKCE